MEMINLQVELHKTQIAAEAAVEQGLVKYLIEIQTYKKKNILHQYVCFFSAMLTSEIITESGVNHSECCGCVNSCNKFVSTRSC